MEVRLDRKFRMSSLTRGTAFLVLVDGRQRCRLETVGKSIDDIDPTCYHCGYSLKGLRAVNGEIRCPECGRHTAAGVLSRLPEPSDEQESAP